MRMKHVRPYPIDGDRLLNEQGPTVCPYCKSQSTSDLGADIGWVEGPIKHTPPRFICVGCCEDIYSTCAADDFEKHPYYSLVQEASAIEGITVTQFRYECLKQQIHIAQQRTACEKTDKYIKRAMRLKQLLRRIVVD